LTGWYGVGTAMRRYVDDGHENSPATPEERLAELQEMARVWPFFRTLLSNMEQVLAKTDLEIARQYSTLVPDARLRQRIFSRISDEYHLTREMFRQVAGRDLLDEDTVLRDALNTR